MIETGTVLTNARPAALRLYRSLIAALQRVGPLREELKKTSVHLMRGSAFAGVQLRREYLIVTIKSERPIVSPRVTKGDQVSKNRWHNEVRISNEADLDHELLAWLRTAYELCA